jgi:hypothetical protein
MTGRTTQISLSDVLEPILDGADGSGEALDKAVGDVAEMLAALGVLIVDRSGRPVHGVTDEMAVMGALGTHGQSLVRQGRMEEAMSVTRVMERVSRLRREPRRRHAV